MTIHLIIDKRYGDIIYWKSVLPQYTFSHYVREILMAEKDGKMAIIPLPKYKGFSEGRIDAKIEVTDKELIKFLKSFPKHQKGEQLKRIIRKHLDYGYQMNNAKPLNMIAVANVNRMLAEAQLYIAKTELEYMDSEEKERRLLEEYQSTFKIICDIFRKLEDED